MSDKKSRQYAEQLLDRLIELDRTVSAAYYEMGQLLFSIREGRLYELIGYKSFNELVEEELSFSVATAANYAKVYSDFKRLKYNKTEALIFLENFGLKNIAKILPKTNEKIGVRAMSNRVKALDEKQISFWMHEAEYEEVQIALEKMGAIKNETGRYMNSSDALVAMARKINGTKLKAVA